MTVEPKVNVACIQKISVIIAAYNAELFLDEAIASVFEQVGVSGVECIVVDDGSTDKTAEIAKSYKSVKYLWQENAGQSRARNAGIGLVEGDAVVFLDADDILEPFNLVINASLLDREPLVSVAAGQARTIRGGRLPWNDLSQNDITAIDFVEMRTYEDILRGNAFVPPSVCMFRVSLLRHLNGFADYASAEDLDLYLRAAKLYPIGVHSQNIVQYRRHEGNHSGNVARMLSETIRVLDIHKQANLDKEKIVRASDEGKRHWISLLSGRLFWECVWAAKKLDFTKAVKSGALYLKLKLNRD